MFWCVPKHSGSDNRVVRLCLARVIDYQSRAIVLRTKNDFHNLIGSQHNDGETQNIGCSTIFNNVLVYKSAVSTGTQYKNKKINSVAIGRKETKNELQTQILHVEEQLG